MPSHPAESPCACAAIRHAARLVTRLYESELHGRLTVPQFALLSVIRYRPGCNQAVLTRALDFDKTTLSRNLKLMEKNGWIAHAVAAVSAVSSDRRERGYHLTPVGSKLLTAAKPAWRRAQDRMRSAMTPDQWDAMWQSVIDITKAARSISQTTELRSR